MDLSGSVEWALGHWSVRITPKNYTLEQVVSDLSGVACVIVKHTWSYRTRKETEQHIHIYWRHPKIVTKDTFNEKVVKKLFPKLDGRRAEYCSTDPVNLNNFLDYTLRDKNRHKKRGASLLYWGLTDLKPAWIDTLVDDPIYEESPPKLFMPMTESPLDAYRGTAKKNTTEDKQEKFFKFVMEYVALKPEKTLTARKVAKLLYEYSKGGFRPEIAPMYINYVLRNYLIKFGEGDPRYKSHRDRWCSVVLTNRVADF